MINTDSYYEIGSGHMFCQDYAANGKFFVDNKEFHYAAVSDGCSSSEGSDLGARFLAKSFALAARLSLSSGEPVETGVQRILLHKMSQGMNLDISLYAMDATLAAILYDVTEDTLHTFIWGDGKFFGKLRTPVEMGALTDITFQSNAPYYLSYLNDAPRDILYESNFSDKYADVKSYLVRQDGIMHFQELDKFKQKSFYEKTKTASTTYSHVSVMTDGVDTYHKVNDLGSVMLRHNVFNQLTQYKATHGDFVKRRMQMVKKFCQKEGWTHFDDVAVATIVF